MTHHTKEIHALDSFKEVRVLGKSQVLCQKYLINLYLECLDIDHTVTMIDRPWMVLFAVFGPIGAECSAMSFVLVC